MRKLLTLIISMMMIINSAMTVAADDDYYPPVVLEEYSENSEETKEIEEVEETESLEYSEEDAEIKEEDSFLEETEDNDDIGDIENSEAEVSAVEDTLVEDSKKTQKADKVIEAIESLEEIKEVVQESNEELSEFITAYLPVDIDTKDFVTRRIFIPGMNWSEKMPASFSLRHSAVTSVKNQGSYGTCWAHAVMASAESTSIVDGEANKNIDLSELKLAYFTYRNEGIADPLGLITNDYSYSIYNTGNNLFTAGGNAYIASIALATGIGFSNEYVMPYSWLPSSSSRFNIHDFEKQFSRGICYEGDYYLENARYLSPSDTYSIKRVIKEYGAIAASHNFDSSFFNGNSCYCPSDLQTNHAITIVGWDDNYSRYSFRSDPGANGAWLIKNSHGSGTNDGGYFWLSYYDKSFANCDALVQFDIAPSKQDELVYQYDGSYSTTKIRLASTKVLEGNIYTASRNEIIDSVGFFSTVPELLYTVYIYTDVDGTPVKGTLATSQDGYLEYAGFTKVDLESPVVLKEGQKFSVVISHNNANTLMIDTNDTSSWLRTVSHCESGQSFYAYRLDGTWHDGYSNDFTFRIKAYTSAPVGGVIDPVEPVDPPVEPKDPVDPVDPIDPVEPKDPVDPVDPIDPVEPNEPDEPFSEDDFWSGFDNKAEEVVLPEGVTSLDGDVLKDCTNLKSLTLPSTLTSMDEHALSMCDKLQEIVIPEEVKEVVLKDDDDTLVCYKVNNYKTEDKHSVYPTGMNVFFVDQESDGDYVATRHNNLDNILTYAGASIRVTGQKGIRIITSIPTAKKNELISKNIDGYKVMEYGTLMCWASDLSENEEPILVNDGSGNFKAKHGAKGRAYSRTDNVYSIYREANGITQYTNTLVGNYSSEQCASDFAMRTYMILRPADAKDGSQDIAVYGGTLYRSISFVAYQNRNAFSPGTSAYEYIWSLIRSGYGGKYDAEYKKG